MIMIRNVKIIVSVLIICFIFGGCKSKDEKAEILNNYVLDTTVHFCYDICGYQTDLYDYYLVESTKNVPNEFPRDYYVLENDTPILSFTIIYSDEPLYGGFVCLYGDGQIAYSRYDTDVSSDVEYNNKTKLCIDDYLIKDEDTVYETRNIEDIRIVSSEEIKKLMDCEYYDLSKEEIEISDPIVNYYAQLENYPSYINRKDIKVVALQDTLVHYLVLKNNECIGVIEYDAFYENEIVNQSKTNEISSDCKFMITSSWTSDVYYLTGDKTKDDLEISKHGRASNAFNRVYNELTK